MRNALSALANVLRLDLGIAEALEAGVTPILKNLVEPNVRMEAPIVEKALQTLWNLSNSHDGKSSAIQTGLLPVSSEWLDATALRTTDAPTYS